MLTLRHVQHLGKSRGWIASCNITQLLRKLHKEKTQGKGKGFAAAMWTCRNWILIHEKWHYLQWHDWWHHTFGRNGQWQWSWW